MSLEGFNFPQSENRRLPETVPAVVNSVEVQRILEGLRQRYQYYTTSYSDEELETITAPATSSELADSTPEALAAKLDRAAVRQNYQLLVAEDNRGGFREYLAKIEPTLTQLQVQRRPVNLEDIQYNPRPSNPSKRTINPNSILYLIQQLKGIETALITISKLPEVQGVLESTTDEQRDKIINQVIADIFDLNNEITPETTLDNIKLIVLGTNPTHYERCRAALSSLAIHAIQGRIPYPLGDSNNGLELPNTNFKFYTSDSLGKQYRVTDLKNKVSVSDAWSRDIKDLKLKIQSLENELQPNSWSRVLSSFNDCANYPSNQRVSNVIRMFFDLKFNSESDNFNLGFTNKIRQLSWLRQTQANLKEALDTIQQQS